MFRPKVLLIQPPIYDFALYDLFFKPYGLLRVGRWLDEAGYDISYLNALDWRDPLSKMKFGSVKRKRNGTGKFFRQPAELPVGVPHINKHYSRYGVLPETIFTAISQAHPDIVCITTGMTYWYEGVKETVAAVRSYAPKAKVLLGGIYATLMPEHAERTTGADAVVIGDGEDQMRALLRSWCFPIPKSAIPYIPLLLPSAWEGSAGVVRLNTGCPLHCDYCASACISPQFHMGDPDSGFSLLMELRERFGIEHVGFYDDALLMYSDKIFKPFLEKVIQSGLSWKFYTPNAVHIRLIDREVAMLMRRAGFQEVRMGFESSSTAFHDVHDHKFSYEDFNHAISLLKEAGFSKRELSVYILAGLPGQYRRDVQQSVQTASDAGVGVSIAEFSPVPGTPAWERTLLQCPYPLASEPVFHNNSFQSTAWEGFTRDDMNELKLFARTTRS